ncbi:hypothetical protein DV735_g888, partial [Chaetothyriales sp. CBS 134920]
MAKKAGVATTPSTAKKQTSLHGFFTKTPTPAPPAKLPDRSSPRKPTTLQDKFSAPARKAALTPLPSSDAVEPEDEPGLLEASALAGNGLPSPASGDGGQTGGVVDAAAARQGTPSRRTKQKHTSYQESDSEGTDGDDIFEPQPRKAIRGRPSKRRRISDSDDEDAYEQGNGVDEDDDMDDFIVPDDSDEDVKPAKRKKSSVKPSQKTCRQHSGRSSPQVHEDETVKLDDLPESSTAQQWSYDPENGLPLQPRSANIPSKHNTQGNTKKKAHMTEPEQRYTWLADVRDMDRRTPDDADYDPRTIYIPPMAWTKFSPFEKQYWEIKQKFWNTIVFFKKGKFYELYENDATIGHQLFDLKLTDRVNMRMVGVPESSLSHWASEFLAKGFKIARVDQNETALGKDMREREEAPRKKSKDDKVIKRELACVLTAGTLVDGSMLQDDMATYCVAIKESEVDGLPAFGVAFVDTATSQFYVTEFIDDADLTRFETFVAQTRPQELLLEKGGLSPLTLRILKNNTGPTTIWNYLKPGKEFWDGHVTVKEIQASDYFPSSWPQVLEEAKEKDNLMSALGALIQYLRTLKIERELITLGNFTWFDPIRKASSLVLDGQTLINLEVFANTFDGGVDGTLFQLLNRCITPFGKRMFKQWVCHPLMDTKKINARLDAVDSLNADSKVRDRFTSQMSKMPDLERLISRVHATTCRAAEFVRVLEGFEQIDYTISLLRDGSSQAPDQDSVIGQLIHGMPELESRLKFWETAFDRAKAKDGNILVPERGIESDFDDSQDVIEQLESDLQSILQEQRKSLGSNAIKFVDVGKEVYQLEVPARIKVPKNWDQVSAISGAKRWYFAELRAKVRELQEAQETHSQIVKDVAVRFYKRFDENYDIWLAAVKIMAQLDCLISLAKASASLGQPSCRPEFIDDERSVLDLVDLRHPCLMENVDDFIPNDIQLGGHNPNLTLLTGANAAGKSTVLRMTCIAVIMAQIGCYLPCSSARLTPVDRIMSRLGAQDHIFAAQSTFFVELAETKKILTEASPRSLVILDELGRGTSSHDGVAVAQAVLHHLASHVGCLGFFATHYHSLGAEFRYHPEVEMKRMAILVDDEERRVTFLYRLENGVAEGSFGMHCASMCGIRKEVIIRAEAAAEAWEHTSKVGKKLGKAAEGVESGAELPLGVLSDVASILTEGSVGDRAVQELMGAIERL